MKKYNFYILIFLMTFILFPTTLMAAHDAIITGSYVRVRSGAGTNYDDLYSLGTNTSISVVDKTLYEGEGCSEKWYKVIYKETTGYVCSKYVHFIDTTYDGINVMDYSARVNGNNVTIRNAASSSSSSLGTLSLGANVGIIAEINNSSDKSCKDWYKIQYYGDKYGYMCKNYITKKSEITLEENEYSITLKDKFPQSYIPYLTYLHSKYPNWIFEPANTNLDFALAVDSEEGKNLMQTSNDSYRTSSTPAEGSSWYKVNSNVIAFYMDPRNWLTEERIFMFENLKYSNEFESLYQTLAKSIFQGGKLGTDTYIIPMLKSGKNNNISPLALATRIRLEVGKNGSDSTNGISFTWKGKTYSGYYNFFNIGAYEDTIDGIKVSSIKRGLLYAAKIIRTSGKEWNDIEVAITEGSNTLANGYVNKGQDTLYYQKFNVAPDAHYSTFNHQYMTNIQAPAIEGNQTYDAYKESNILNQNFVFEIPIYKNMPEYTSLPNSGDTNNELSKLEIEGYSITPKFDTDILSYEAYIPTSVESIKILTEKVSELSTVNGDGEIKLETNETTITISVVSQSGNEKKYTIEVKKVDDTTTVNDVISKNSLIVNDNTISKLKNNTKVETLKSNLIKSGARKVAITNKSGTELTDSSIIATGCIISITTAVETKNYTISVNGDTSGDGQITILDLLQIQKHIKNISKLNGVYYQAADTSGDNNITILDLLQVQKHIKKIKLL